MIDPRSIYAIVGEEGFNRLTAAFYEGVAGDPLLRPLYPQEELEPARRRLALFLMQYFGGPTTYSAERGHPRLRMRHFAFPIDQARRDAWLRHMTAAIDSLGLPAELAAPLREYVTMAAAALTNRAG